MAEGGGAEGLGEITIDVASLTGMLVTVDLNEEDTVQDARQLLCETIECCYITSYDLVAPDGTVLSDGDSFAGAAKGAVYTMQFRRYEDKDVRHHVAHTQEVLMAALDEVMISVNPTRPRAGASPCGKSYPSPHKVLGQDLRHIVDTSTDGVYQAALHSVEYSLDPSCAHSVGYTFQTEKKLLEQAFARRGSRQLTDPPELACAEEFDRPVTDAAFYSMLGETPAQKHPVVPPVTLQWSSCNPPSRVRRLQGDLAYVDVSFASGAQAQVTCTAGGFFVNSSKPRGDFNPQPAAKPCSAETLFGLLCQLQPKFKEKACELLRTRASVHPFETGPLSQPAVAPWLHDPQPPDAAARGLRVGEGSPSVADYQTPLRAWNEEAQLLQQLPDDTYPSRLEKERMLLRLHHEFVEFAARVAVLAADGQLNPLNPLEPPDSWVYVANNVFVSIPADPRGTYAGVGGARAARYLAKKDVDGIAHIRRSRLDVATVSTAVFDYKGRRIVCQSLVPGILIQRVDGKGATPQVVGIAEDEGGVYLAEEAAQEAMADLGRKLCMKSHRMRGASGAVVDVHTNAELKVMRSPDNVLFLLECSRMAPRDLNSPHDALAFVRMELKEEFARSKRSGAAYDALRARHDAALQEAEALPADERVEAELNAAFAHEKALRELEAREPPVMLNCDRFAFNHDMEFVGAAAGATPEEAEAEARAEAEDRKVLEELAGFLRGKVREVVRRVAQMEAVDTQMLAPLFHAHGVNMRYLGAVAAALPPGCGAARRLLATEMVARVAKHRLRDVLEEHCGGDVATPAAAALSELLSSAALPQQQQQQPSAAAKKKKNKKKKQQQQQQQQQPAAAVDDAAADAAPAEEVPPVAAVDPLAAALEADTPLFAEPAASCGAEGDWVVQEVWKHFRYKLPPGYLDTATLGRFLVLRAVALKLGLTLRKRAYDFSAARCVTADDVLDVSPLHHHKPPPCTIVDILAAPPRRAAAEPEAALRRLHSALQHSNQLAGAVCSASAECYLAQAKHLLKLNDADAAIQDQHKALVSLRRVYGPADGRLVAPLRTMGLMAHLSGRTQAAHAHLLRAIYLARFLGGDAPLELLLAAASFYHETDHPARAHRVLRHLIARAEALGPYGQVSLAAARQHEAMVCGAEGNPDGAVESQRLALALYTKTLGKGHQQTADAESWYQYWVKIAVEKKKAVAAAANSSAKEPPQRKPAL